MANDTDESTTFWLTLRGHCEKHEMPHETSDWIETFVSRVK